MENKESVNKEHAKALLEYEKRHKALLYKTQTIQDCESFEELKKAFIEIEPVQGTQKDYSGQRLSEKLDQLEYYLNAVPFDKIPWNLITRTHGIRAKCMELFYYKKNNF